MACLKVLERLLDRRCGGSTGTNFWATMQLVGEMIDRGESGSVVTLICDSGERYLDTYYNPEWLAAQNFDTDTHEQWLNDFIGL